MSAVTDASQLTSGRTGAGGSPPASLHLDAGQYTVLWRRLGLGEKPVLLDTPDHGVTYSARDAADAAAWARLVAEGLVDDAGRVRPDVADALAVLRCPVRELDVRIRSDGPRILRTAVARGELGVVAGLDADAGLHLRVHPGAQHPEALAAALLLDVPAGRPLPGATLSVPATVRGRDAAARRRSLRTHGVPDATADRLAAVWAEPPRRSMRFGGTWRDTTGRRRHPEVLTVLDTAPGRVLVRRAADRVEFRPVDRGALHAEVARLAVPPVPGRASAPGASWASEAAP